MTRDVLSLWPEGDGRNQDDQGKPQFSVFLPAGTKARSGKAVIVCPGGGYEHLADHEGDCFAELFAERGHVAFVLRYRVRPHRFPAPQIDAARAVRLVRSLSAQWGVDPGAVGLMGFSAGGHLACTVGTQPDLCRGEPDDLAERFSARPDFMILAYPVISLLPPCAHEGSAANLLGPNPSPRQREELSGHCHVTPETPQTFLFHTADDPSVPVENSLSFAAACRARGVPVELHVFSHGPHGVGMAREYPHLRGWTNLLLDWMERF
ncbi:MAG: alpha/beta hydrolase [Phycisphaerae bacterium]|nr:alpha/beta hydrolase [Phycisphaerae bacterium]